MIRTAILRTTTVFGAVLWAASAFADTCGAGMDQVLRCQMQAGKTLQVCIGQGKARYSYGPKGAPELAMTHPLGQVQGTAWAGVGRTLWEEIIFNNNGVSYTVWIASDRNDLDQPPAGGVRVTQGAQTLAELQCRKGTADIALFSVEDGFKAAGFCWDRTAARYVRGCS